MRLAPDSICPLTSRHSRSHFDCGNETLNRYLRQQARQDQERSVSVTFVLTDWEDHVLGYYTLASAAIELDALPQDIARKLPRYAHLPVTLLGRLALDLRVQGQGVGKFLLYDALRRSLENSHIVGSMAVIVHAKHQPAVLFCQNYGFAHIKTLPQPVYPVPLFLSMRKIASTVQV